MHRENSKADHLLKTVLGLIPARGGSKRIPRKNIAPLAGRPLLAYTCEAALGSRMLTRVVLSTDDDEIAEIGRKCGVEVPFMRPKQLGRADTPSLPVVQHAVRWLMKHEDWRADVVVLLQPTSPLRRSHQIDEALECLDVTGADTVVSVTELSHRFSPYTIMRLQDGCLRDFLKKALRADRFRRQNLPTLYARNGPAILASRVQVFLNSDSLYGKRIVPYMMSEEDSVDIDTPFDFQLAEWLIAQRAAKI